jgi:hypothetical protein
MDVNEILPQIERLPVTEIWGAKDTLIVKYHRALEQCEQDVEHLLSQISALEDACETLEAMNEDLSASDLAKQVEYLEAKLEIITPALEVLTEESLEMYNAELLALDKKYDN